MEQPQNQTTLSPKYLILKAIEVKNDLLKYWWVVILMAIIGAGIGFYADSLENKRVTYGATITFSVSGSNSGQENNFGSMFGLQTNNDASLFSGENLFYMLKTRPVLESALLSNCTLSDGSEEVFINYYVDSSFVKEDQWEKMAPALLKVRMPKGVNPKKLTREQQQMLDAAANRIKNETKVVQPNIKTAFIELTGQLENEMLSKAWVEVLLATIQEKYQENQTRKSRQMLGIMQRRADSLAYVLNRNENRLAKTTDMNEFTVVPTAKVEENRLTRNSAFVGSLYLEAQRSLESLRMSIIKETPLFTVIEPVHLPLEPVLFHRTNTKFGIAIGIFLAILFIILRQTYTEALRDSKPAEAASSKK